MPLKHADVMRRTETANRKLQTANRELHVAKGDAVRMCALASHQPLWIFALLGCTSLRGVWIADLKIRDTEKKKNEQDGKDGTDGTGRLPMVGLVPLLERGASLVTNGSPAGF